MEMTTKQEYKNGLDSFASMNYGMLSVIEQGIPEEQRILMGELVSELSEAVIDNAERFDDERLMLYQTLLLQGAILEVMMGEDNDE